MSDHSVYLQLKNIEPNHDFIEATRTLVDEWRQKDVGLDGVNDIIRFMELHPENEYGSPGPLVHFVEEFYKQGYESKLIESVLRKPTPHTVWMLNRILNAENDVSVRGAIFDVLKQILNSHKCDSRTSELVKGFVRIHDCSNSDEKRHSKE